ncbi:helix-turn-helix domain-containing protein [Levilactobacillus yiduensis]|uniref:helix-turn-helix domain-containing protein n=1 Tax=Levilactobacillus yiduensis TaxID=2953880 RepID=UPI001AD80CEF|nr:helix-turn-helix transcriptional regulator [Levilactobacillus yiduensis]
MIESNLRKILDKNKISISDLSTATQISRKTLTQLADNKTNGIKFNTLNSLINILDVPVEEILHFSSDEVLSISKLKINDDRINFVATQKNKTTGQHFQVSGKATFSFIDDIFIFSSPQPDSSDRSIFNRIIFNGKSHPGFNLPSNPLNGQRDATKNIQKSLSNSLDNKDTNKAAKSLTELVDNSLQSQDMLTHDFSIKFLISFCLELMKVDEQLAGKVFTIKNSAVPIFVIHWNLKLVDFQEKAENINYTTVIKTRQLMPYLMKAIL